MGEARRRTERQKISVLIPERGRPESLERTITSLIDTAGEDTNFEIIVYIDSDDPAWLDKEPVLREQVRYIKRERPPTLGEKLNIMAKMATGDILFFLANDTVMDTHGWPNKFREATYKLPNGMGVPFVKDPLHPGHSSYWLMTRRMMEVIGFFAAPWFPYWWIDNWAAELGILMGVYQEIDVSVSAPDGRGKTHGMIDVDFWAQFFHETRPMRLRDAIRLAEEAFGKNSPAFAGIVSTIGQRQEMCAAMLKHQLTSEFAATWGQHTDSPPSPKYGGVKAYAERQLANLRKEAPRLLRVALCVPSGRTVEALTSTCVAALAARTAASGIEICVLNVQSSTISHGRNATVDIALQQQCDYLMWLDADMRVPADTLLRLLKHNKDIVGATYNKRVPPYATLGKLIGPKPDTLTDGLQEAVYLPGGIMLIKASVYKALKKPWYYETYKWPGADGVESFEGLLQNYFMDVPPADAVAELRDTKLGEWLKDHYVISPGGPEDTLRSEDISFCISARKAGMQVFCDLKLTGECAHIGQTEITCDLGPDIVRLPEAAD